MSGAPIEKDSFVYSEQKSLLAHLTLGTRCARTPGESGGPSESAGKSVRAGESKGGVSRSRTIGGGESPEHAGGKGVKGPDTAQRGSVKPVSESAGRRGDLRDWTRGNSIMTMTYTFILMQLQSKSDDIMTKMNRSESP